MGILSAEKINLDTTLAEIVSANVNCAEVLDSFDLDYGNHGDRTLKQACKENRINSGSLMNALIRKFTAGRVCSMIREWNLRLLCDFIATDLHARVMKYIPQITENLKCLSKRGSNTAGLRKNAEEFCCDLSSHIRKEQKMLYPYFRNLSDHAGSEDRIDIAPFGSVSNPIKVLKNEHLRLCEKLIDLRRMGLEMPAGTSVSQEAESLGEILAGLQKSLRLCIHFENNLLFPKAMVLEKRSIRKSQKSISKSIRS